MVDVGLFVLAFAEPVASPLHIIVQGSISKSAACVLQRSVVSNHLGPTYKLSIQTDFQFTMSAKLDHDSDDEDQIFKQFKVSKKKWRSNFNLIT